MKDAPRVRHARVADLPQVAELAAEHATYEKTGPPVAVSSQRERLLGLRRAASGRSAATPG